MNRFDRSFCDDPILDGSDYIAASLAPGVEVFAFIEFDPFTKPDSEAEDADSIAAWERDEWKYCDMTLKLYVHGACIDNNVVTLGGIDSRSGEYITERANDLLSDNETDMRYIVGEFARKVARAAKAMEERSKT